MSVLEHARRLGPFEWACLLLAPPLAWAFAAWGFPMPVREPLRDLAAVLAWSVAEEIVFRGALQPLLARAFGPWRGTALVTPANVATSVVFAALHAWQHGAVVALGVFPVSLVYGVARERSGGVLLPAALHVWFNVLLYAASWRLATA